MFCVTLCSPFADVYEIHALSLNDGCTLQCMDEVNEKVGMALLELSMLEDCHDSQIREQFQYHYDMQFALLKKKIKFTKHLSSQQESPHTVQQATLVDTDPFRPVESPTGLVHVASDEPPTEPVGIDRDSLEVGPDDVIIGNLALDKSSSVADAEIVVQVESSSSPNEIDINLGYDSDNLISMSHLDLDALKAQALGDQHQLEVVAHSPDAAYDPDNLMSINDVAMSLRDGDDTRMRLPSFEHKHDDDVEHFKSDYSNALTEFEFHSDQSVEVHDKEIELPQQEVKLLAPPPPDSLDSFDPDHIASITNMDLNALQPTSGFIGGGGAEAAHEPELTPHHAEHDVTTYDSAELKAHDHFDHEDQLTSLTEFEFKSVPNDLDSPALQSKFKDAQNVPSSKTTYHSSSSSSSSAEDEGQGKEQSLPETVEVTLKGQVADVVSSDDDEVEEQFGVTHFATPSKSEDDLWQRVERLQSSSSNGSEQHLKDAARLEHNLPPADDLVDASLATSQTATSKNKIAAPAVLKGSMLYESDSSSDDDDNNVVKTSQLQAQLPSQAMSTPKSPVYDNDSDIEEMEVNYRLIESLKSKQAPASDTKKTSVKASSSSSSSSSTDVEDIVEEALRMEKQGETQSSESEEDVKSQVEEFSQKLAEEIVDSCSVNIAAKHASISDNGRPQNDFEIQTDKVSQADFGVQENMSRHLHSEHSMQTDSRHFTDLAVGPDRVAVDNNGADHDVSLDNDDTEEIVRAALGSRSGSENDTDVDEVQQEYNQVLSKPIVKAKLITASRVRLFHNSASTFYLHNVCEGVLPFRRCTETCTCAHVRVHVVDCSVYFHANMLCK